MRTGRLPSLRTELLLNLAVLALAALLVAVTSVWLFGELVDPAERVLFVGALIAADLVIFVAFGASLVQRLVLRPLAEATAAAEAIADGDLARRVPDGPTQELAALSESFNRMTERLLTERAHLVRAEKLASVGRLAAGVAHEIGNPLGAVNGYAHLLRRKVGDGDGASAVQGIEREMGRIDRIVRGLLDYARPRRLTPAPADVHAAIRNALQILADQGVLKKIDVKLHLAPRAPAILGDRHEVEQLVVNLVLNAADAMEGEGVLTVHTAASTVGELRARRERRSDDPPGFAAPRPGVSRSAAWLDRMPLDAPATQVIVADSGPGVPDENVERVFDPFFTTKEPGRGTGLGLAIAARIVEGLGGVIWVQRAREGGAAFCMLFPLAGAGGGMLLTLPRATSRTPVRS